jgi:hypothetical protein
MLVSGVMHAADARADDPVKAREVAERGVAAAGEGRRTGNPAKFTEAVALFKEAFALHPDPEYQCSIGIAYRDLEDRARAHLYLGRCIARTTAPERKEALAKVQAKLEADLRLSHVPVDVVVVPAGAQVTVSAFSAEDPFAAPWLVWLPAGTHTFEASAAGYEPASKPITIDPDMPPQTISITLARQVTEPALPPREPPREPDQVIGPAVDPVPPVEPPPAEGKRPSRLAGKLVIGGGVLLLAGGGLFHALAVGNIGDLDELSGAPRASKVSTIEKQRAAAIGLYAGGGIAVGVGLWLTLRKPKHAPAVSVAPLPEGGAMLVWSTER